MKRCCTFALLCLGGFLCRAGAEAVPARPGWMLVFHDEFNGAQLDPQKWNPHDPWGGERNNELQAYVSDAFQLHDGILCLRAEIRSAVYAHKQRSYTSGMMTTFRKFSQRYGRFEVRCRVPRGKGFWPAVWLLPVTEKWPPEIDLLEILGNDPTVAHFTSHWGKDAPGKHQQHGESMSGVDFSRDFHVFALEWSPGSMTWFVDGLQRARVTEGVPHEPMYLLLNLAVGGNFEAGLPGAPDRATPFPSCFEVDYVRVYRAK